ATVSNADELRRWIEEVHGPMALVYHDERAIPLEHYYFLDNTLHLVQDAAGRRVERFPGVGGETKLARIRNRNRRFTFGGDRPPPRLGDLLARRRPDEATRTEAGGIAGAKGRAGQASASTPGQTADEEDEAPERLAPEAGEVLSALRAANLLPCLYFLPGRRAVETAAQSAASHLLVSPDQRARLAEQAQAWIKTLPPEDQRLDQAQRLLQLAPRGIGFHHAGLLPSLKVMVETLFARGELKAVFATDTLALGINMPARSVVVGSLSKFDGVQMRLMTPNEYQQLTGRAGRRGMDEKGAAVIPYSPWEPFEPAFAALTGPLEPVTSAFTVRYNTVLNLWRAGDQTRLRKAVAASLREYQRRAFLAQGYGSLARRGVYGVPGSGGGAAPTRTGEGDVRADYEQGQGARADKRKRRGRGEATDPTSLSDSAAAELNATIYVLRSFGYIGADDELTIRGRMLRAIFHPAGITLCELVLSGALDELGAAELAELFSWFTFDNDKSLRNLFSLSGALMSARRIVWRVLRAVQEFEGDEGIEMTPGIVDGFHGVALNWARGVSLSGLLRKIDLAEGDLLVTLNQTIDLLQQVQSAVGQTLDARDLWERAAPDAGYAQQRQNWRQRLELLRPRLTEAWRSLLRGSVALSRAIPAMAAPIPPAAKDAATTQASDVMTGGAIPAALPAAEDADPDEQRRDREEAPPEG
ncbi:MAG TPA: helicase-related protein, partial [Ktedonobacterales bacterium]|nr:helicase-related protein [Ktedonobacterales bacterium]